MEPMIMKRWWLVVAFCVVVTLPTQAQSAGSRDEASIKAQLAAYADASQRGDGTCTSAVLHGRRRSVALDNAHTVARTSGHREGAGSPSRSESSISSRNREHQLSQRGRSSCRRAVLRLFTRTDWSRLLRHGQTGHQVVDPSDSNRTFRAGTKIDAASQAHEADGASRRCPA